VGDDEIMGRPQPKFNEKEISEIKQKIKETKNKNAYKRLMVLQYKAIDKITSEKISELTGYHKDTVNRIVRRYKENGIEAILNPKYSGNRRYLSKEEEKDFIEGFEKRANKGEMLEISEIAKEFNERIGKEADISTIYYFLKRNGWRKVMPRSKHPNKASDEAIGAYKKNL
jgi:transposase